MSLPWRAPKRAEGAPQPPLELRERLEQRPDAVGFVVAVRIGFGFVEVRPEVLKGESLNA